MGLPPTDRPTDSIREAVSFCAQSNFQRKRSRRSESRKRCASTAQCAEREIVIDGVGEICLSSCQSRDPLSRFRFVCLDFRREKTHKKLISVSEVGQKERKGVGGWMGGGMQDARLRISCQKEVQYRGLKKKRRPRLDAAFIFALTKWSIRISKNVSSSSSRY